VDEGEKGKYLIAAASNLRVVNIWESGKEMKVIKEVICSKCGKKQKNNIEEILKSDLFWQVCEFCGRYGLKVENKVKMSITEWLESFYNTLGFGLRQNESRLKDLLKGR
jgi:hypothetical protein